MFKYNYKNRLVFFITVFVLVNGTWAFAEVKEKTKIIKNSRPVTQVGIYGVKNVDLLLLYPDGKKVGRDPISSKVHQEVTDVSYERDFGTTEDSRDELDKSTTIIDPSIEPGVYRLQIIGVKTGTCKMEISSIQGGASSYLKFGDEIEKGQVEEYVFRITSDGRAQEVKEAN